MITLEMLPDILPSRVHVITIIATLRWASCGPGTGPQDAQRRVAIVVTRVHVAMIWQWQFSITTCDGLLLDLTAYHCLKVRSHCVRVRISFSIRFSFRVRRTVYTESEFLSVFDLISCPQLPRQTSKCDFVSGLARFGWKWTSVSVFHGRGTDRNGTDANLMALNRRLIRKLMQSKHCF